MTGAQHSLIIEVMHDPSAYAAVVSAVSPSPQPVAGSHNSAQAASRPQQFSVG